jgi:hypothetical protein
VPSDPAKAVASALGEARALLRAIEGGSEDDDFQEDFGLYWRQQPAPGRRARLLLPERRETGVIAWTSAGTAYYGFGSAAALRRWWKHRFHVDPEKIRQGALVALDQLPYPGRYPRTGADLWDLVEAHSAGGAAVLGGLLRQTPKSLLVILTGTAPSGRRHAVGAVISRPPDMNPDSPDGLTFCRRRVPNLAAHSEC